MATKISKLLQSLAYIPQNNILGFITSAMRSIANQYTHNSKFLNLTRSVLKEIHFGFQALKWDSKVTANNFVQ
jgi:hypothetical protein